MLQLFFGYVMVFDNGVVFVWFDVFCYFCCYTLFVLLIIMVLV